LYGYHHVSIHTNIVPDALSDGSAGSSNCTDAFEAQPCTGSEMKIEYVIRLDIFVESGKTSGKSCQTHREIIGVPRPGINAGRKI
jgi:hypothetical protein